MGLVAIAPTIIALSDSLRDLSLTIINRRGEFIGLENYRIVLGHDENFFPSLWRTVTFVAIVVPIEFFAGLAIALWLDALSRGRRIITTLIMLPTMIAPVVVGMIWRNLLMPTFGPLTNFFQAVGLFADTSVFSEATTAFIAIALIDVWQWTPFMMLIMFAGLSAMSRAPIEAARIDGASSWQIAIYIRIPLLKPLIIIALLFRTIDATRLFDKVYVLTGGGPGGATEFISTYAHRTAFVQWNLGYAAALCLVIAFMSVIIAAFFYKLSITSKK